jgi:hypothetical protein
LHYLVEWIWRSLPSQCPLSEVRIVLPHTAFTIFGKSRALAKLKAPVPLFGLKFLDRIGRSHRRNFKIGGTWPQARTRMSNPELH